MSLLERAFAVSAYIQAAKEPVSPKQLADALAIPLSTVYRLLIQLKNWGYISDSYHQGLLTSGPLFCQQGGNYQRFSLLMYVAKAPLQQLAAGTRETAALITATPMQTVCVDMAESPQRLRCSFAAGETQSPVQGCSAKTLLAYRDTAEQEALIARYVPEKERQEYRKHLMEIRAQGFGQSLGEVDDGIWGVSAPIVKKRQILAVATVMVPVQRMKDADFFIAQALDCAKNINELIILQNS